MGETSRNKEILENKFLIERFLLKLLESQKITQDQVQDLKWLFRKELLSHEQRTPKQRLEILVAVFREWKNKNGQSQVEATSSQIESSPRENAPQTTTSSVSAKEHVPVEMNGNPSVFTKNEAVASPNEPALQKPVENATASVVQSQVKKEATQPVANAKSGSNEVEILKNLVHQMIADDLELTSEHKEVITSILDDEAQHVAGTGMSPSVVKRYLVNVLERYKREHELKYKAQDIEVAPQHVESEKPQQTTQTVKVEERVEPVSIPANTEAYTHTENTGVTPEVPVSSSPFKPKTVEPVIQEDVEQVETPQAAPEEVAPAITEAEMEVENKPVPEVVSEVQVASSQEKPTPSESVQQVVVEPEVTQPTSQQPIQKQDEEPVFKTKVTSGEGISTNANTHGKSLAEMIMQQAREADQKNPLSSHQEAIPIPEKAKQIQKDPVDISKVKIVEEEGIDPEKFAKMPVQKDIPEEEIKKEGLGGASNTFVSFDKDVELDGDQIGKRHEVRSQQKKLFEKYVKEQLDTVLQVISNHRVYDSLTLESIREDLTNDAMRIADKDEISISDKIHELDTLFTEKRDEYVKNRVVDPHTPLEEMVDIVMARAGQEVRTKDAEADARFRETLRDTLHFKAKHLLGVGKDKNAIQTALDEEYVKHKTFYFKTSV